MDRAAEGKSKIVVAQRGTSEAFKIVKKVVGGEEIVAEKFIGAAMESIGSRASYYVDLSASATSEFGVVIAAQDLEFRDGINAGKSQQRLVGAAVDVVGAVEGPLF